MNKKCLKYTLITIVIASMSWSIWQNVRVYRALRQADFNQANQLSRQALILPKLLNLITFEQIEILQLWEFALEQIPNLQQLANNLQQYLEQSFGYQAVDEHLPTEIITNLEKFNSDLNKIDTKRLKNIQALSQDLLVVAKKTTG